MSTAIFTDSGKQISELSVESAIIRAGSAMSRAGLCFMQAMRLPFTHAGVSCDEVRRMLQ